MIVEFFVPGIPRPGGSKKGFYSPKLGRVMMVKAGGQKEENWRQAVSYVAAKAMGEKQPLTGPIRLDVQFFLPRPKFHFHTGKKLAGQLKADAPKCHHHQPDRGKLLRSTEDALTGIVYADDAQVCAGDVSKVYSARPGAMIRAEQIVARAIDQPSGDKGLPLLTMATEAAAK